ncbi:MAG: rhomboid family intramembrane serine protease [Verrucomicrobiota bacterium]
MFPLADTAKEKGPRAVTKLLIAVNVVVYGWELWLWMRGGNGLGAFVSDHSVVAKRLVSHPLDPGQWWTLVTSQFLHGGLAHLLGNMWFLWIFGGNVEWRLGWFRYLMFYLFAGIAAALAQVMAGPFSTATLLGASGAISGVMGAYLILFPTSFVLALVPWIVPIMPIPALLFLPLWFVFQAYSGIGALLGLGDDGVAWWAHAGGFLAGVAMVIYAKKARWVSRG